MLKLNKEHEEARNVSIRKIDFTSLNSGIYNGCYEGGRYQWRKNTCSVKIDSGKVVSIDLLSSTDPGKENTDHTLLYQRIIDNQSLQVDAICGASLTTKAYLKAVEDALLKAK